MSPDYVIAAYRRALDQVGTEAEVTIRRYSGPAGPSRAYFEAPCRARVIGDREVELIGSVNQVDFKAIVFVEDLVNAQFPLPITETDKAIIRGKEFTIKFSDSATRRVQGVLIAYEFELRG